MAYYSIEPFGEYRQDLRAGTIVQASLAPWSKRRLMLKDCMLRFGENKRREMEEWKTALRMYTKQMGGRIDGRD